jgi:KDO2-lipid IV(A) lauroyltransferase
VNPVISALLRGVFFCAGTASTFLPRALEIRLGRGLGRLALALDWKRKRIAQANMARCLPELSNEARARLLVENYRHYGTLGLELIHYFSPFVDHYRTYARQTAVLEGFENWKAVHDRGRGTLFVSLHMANWELMAAVGAMAGIPITMVTRRLKPAWLHNLMERRRLSVNVRCVYQPRTLPTVMKALRQGESVGFVMDQYAPPPMGIPVPFFGVKVDTLAAVGTLAQRTGAGVVFATQIREASGLVRIVISPALDLGPELADPTAATARLAREIESLIRANPSQWLWVHRRFKNIKTAPAPAGTAA